MIRKNFVFICIGILMLVLTFFGLMSFLGYRLIEMAVTYILFGLLAALVLGKLAFWLAGKVRNKNLRLLTGIACGLGALGIVLLLISFFVFVNNFYTPQQFTVLESESGREVVVLRQFSQKYSYERCDSRGGEIIDYQDLGYQYQIFPVFSKIFYNSKQPGTGELEIGCMSQAVLMHEWNGDALHMYIQNPEEFDIGELTLQ